MQTPVSCLKVRRATCRSKTVLPRRMTASVVLASSSKQYIHVQVTMPSYFPVSNCQSTLIDFLKFHCAGFRGIQGHKWNIHNYVFMSV